MKGRKISWILAGFVAALVVLLTAYIGLLLSAPYTSSAIPTDCTTATSHLPSALTYDVPGVGVGTLLTADATSALVVSGEYGHSPFHSHVYLISKSTERVLLTLTFDDDIFAAAFNDRILYLYDNAVLYRIDTLKGQAVSSLVTSDNYRQILTSGGVRSMQTDTTIFELGGSAVTAVPLHLHLATMAYGCILSR